MPANPVRTVAWVTAATLAAYAAWLGWDQTKDLHPDSSRTGPYQPWQVVGLALTLGLTAAAAGWRRRPALAAIVMTFVLTTSWILDAATEPPTDNDGLWPIGAFFVGVGSLVGLLAAAWTGYFLAYARQSRPSWSRAARQPTVGGSGRRRR